MGQSCCSKGGSTNDASTTNRATETGKTPLVGNDGIAQADLYGGNTAAAAAEPSSPSGSAAPSAASMASVVMDPENSESVTSDSNDTEVDELHRVNASELGKFVIKKMNNKTLDRLWKHLDEDQTGHISRDEVLNILQWMSVLYVAFRFRQQGGQGQPQINKRKLKAQFVPVKDWILANKMNTKKVVHRAEFRKVFGAWLEEYGKLNGYE